MKRNLYRKRKKSSRSQEIVKTALRGFLFTLKEKKIFPLTLKIFSIKGKNKSGSYLFLKPLPAVDFPSTAIKQKKSLQNLRMHSLHIILVYPIIYNKV